MPELDIDYDVAQRWWENIQSYSWEAARTGLNIILTNQIIDRATYTRLLAALSHLEELGIDFPTSSRELMTRVNYYL